MQTIESLRRKIENAQDLLSVVTTMKALAAVNIRHYERAVESLAEYNRTVEMGLHILLSAENGRTVNVRPASHHRLGAVLFGSDQGLCGQFNERLVTHALEDLARRPESANRQALLSVGGRNAALLEDARLPLQAVVPTPSGLAGITPLVQDLLVYIEQWRMGEGIDHVVIFHNQPLGGAAYAPVTTQLLPVDLDWLRSLHGERWSSRTLPTFTMDWGQLFAALIRQYMFVALYRASAESLASEDAARMASMQNAERNIEERIEELHRRYHSQRQNQITAELLDIVSGYEAVMGKQR